MCRSHEVFCRYLIYPFVVIVISLATSACQKSPEKQPEKKPAKVHLVEIETVATRSLNTIRTRTGTLRTRREVKIHTQEEGKIIKYPYYEGDPVKHGDLLVKLDDTLIKVQLNRATALRKQAQLDVTRLKKLRSSNIVSEDEYMQALTRLEIAKADEQIFKTRLGYTIIKSPIDGLVTARLSESGNIVQQYDHILSIADPSSLFTEVRVSGLLIPYLTVGDVAQIKIDALGKQFYAGHISRIFPQIDPATRRGTIEVELTSVPQGAIAGQLCRVELVSRAADRQVIKYSALRRDVESEYVFIIDENNVAQRADISTGLRLADNIEVISGLKDGQNVVTKGFLGLVTGKHVKPVISHIKVNNE